MTTWKIWLEAVPGNSGRFGSFPPIPAGWYGGRPTSINQPIYMRTRDESLAVVMHRRESVIRLVREWRDKGYPCKAVPPIEVRETI